MSNKVVFQSTSRVNIEDCSTLRLDIQLWPHLTNVYNFYRLACSSVVVCGIQECGFDT